MSNVPIPIDPSIAARADQYEANLRELYGVAQERYDLEQRVLDGEVTTDDVSVELEWLLHRERALQEQSCTLLDQAIKADLAQGWLRTKSSPAGPGMAAILDALERHMLAAVEEQGQKR